MDRFCILAVGFALTGLINNLPAQAPSPLDLARGLRETAQPDLALEYLDHLEAKNPTADIKVVLPLERAISRLSLAQLETDESARAGGITQAKSELEQFLKQNAGHPRAGEGNASLAQLISVQAKSQLNQSYKIRGPGRAAAAAAVRPLFLQASDLFGKASAQIQKQLSDDGTDPLRKKVLLRESLQAELDRGINQFNLVDTYLSQTPKDISERAAHLDSAKAIFVALGRKDDTNPACWAARAWAGACDLEKTEKAEAVSTFKKIRDDAKKAATPASAEGVRMVDFFEVQSKYLEATQTSDKTRALFVAARTDATKWLENDRSRPKMTPQRLSVTYYYAYLTMQLGINEVIFKKQSKEDESAGKPRAIQSVPNAARTYLLEASREFKKLMETDNEYTDRAADQRAIAVRYLVGDTIREPKDYSLFEECQMAAQMQLDHSLKEENEDAKAKGLTKAIALLERSNQLATPAVPVKEQLETRMMLVYACLQADNFTEAAQRGDALARTPRGGPVAAKAGYFAIDAYLKNAEKLEEGDADGKAALRRKAIDLSTYLDKTYPSDSSTDAARFRIGRVNFEDRKLREAFELLSKISPSYTGIISVRLLQGRTAFQLINAKDPPLSPPEKEAISKRAIAQCAAVPMPNTPTEMKGYFSLRNLLGNLYLSHPPEGLPLAEKIATETMTRAATAGMEADDQKAIVFAADELRLRAIYSQAVGLYKDGKYPEMAAKLKPVLEAMDKAGPALAGKADGEAGAAAASLDRFRRDFVVLAMQGRIREGAIEPAAQLFELLDKLGGTVEATTDALTRLVSLVRPQLEDLRRQKKTDEANKLAQSVAGMLVKQSEKPKLAAQVQSFLGRSLRDLGVYDKAIEILLKVPTPSAELLKQKTGEIADEDQRNSVVAYQVAQIELARSYRLSHQYDKADGVLKAALGTDKEKGWAKSMEFRKEAVYLLEDKAADAPAANKLKQWAEAKAGWEKLANEVAGAVRNPKVQPNERERLLPLYLETLCDLRRCLARANTQVLAATPAKLNESLGKLAGQIFETETGNASALTAEVKAKYAALLNDYPAMKSEYTKRGGKAFLE